VAERRVPARTGRQVSNILLVPHIRHRHLGFRNISRENQREGLVASQPVTPRLISAAKLQAERATHLVLVSQWYSALEYKMSYPSTDNAGFVCKYLENTL
jgi:hypothetical protein